MSPGDSVSITDQLAKRVRELLQGAEEQAKQVMADAEAEVKRVREAAAAQGHTLIEDARKALDDLEGRLGTADAPPSEEPAVPDPVPQSEPVTEDEPEPESSPAPAVPDPVPEAPPAGEGPASPARARGGDESAARLVAMKMALDGTSRNEVRSRLEADYSVADLDGLLDDVFAKAGK